MNPDTLLVAQDSVQTHLDPEGDSIPILDEALELSPNPNQHEGPLRHQRDAETNSFLEESLMDKTPAPGAPSEPREMELSIDLGYAEEAEDFMESDSLAEMEEIQTLPLAEMVLDDEQDALASAEQKRQIATLEAIVFEGENPNAPAPKSSGRIEPPSFTPSMTEFDAAETAEANPGAEPAFTPPFAPPPAGDAGKPLPKKSENPFLPQHILDRLNQGKRNLVEEIAQSSAALDASTAILRTHARADRLSRSTHTDNKAPYSFSRDKSAQQKQKMVDDLVDEYLPLIAAELRRRLRKILDE